MITKKVKKHPYIPILGQSVSIKFKLDAWLEDSHRRYGSVSQFKLLLVGKSYLCLDKSYFHSVLIDNHEKISSKIAFQKSAGPFLSNGLMLQDSGDHKSQRKKYQHAFHVKNVHRYYDVMGQVFDHRFSKCIEAGEMQVDPTLRRMLFSNTMALFFGSYDQRISDRLSDAYHCVLHQGINSIIRFSIPGLPFYKATKESQFIDNEMKHLIEKKKNHLGDDLMSQILVSLPGIDDAQAFKNTLDGFKFLLFAAHDTLYSTLAFALLHLSKDRAMQTKLADFVMQQDKTSLVLKVEKTPDLLDCLFFETLRLYPAVPIITRAITEDFCLDDWTLMKGKCLTLSPLFVHRHEAYWSKPNEFILDRFIDPAYSDAIKSAYFPFGLGQHKCIGMPLTQMIFRMVISTVLTCAEIAYVDNGDTISYVPFFEPCRLKLKIKKRRQRTIKRILLVESEQQS